MTDSPHSREDFSPIRWSREGFLELLDQTRLPAEEVWLECRRVDDVAGAIYRLSVRGAPAIGVTAAYGLVVALDECVGPDRDGGDWEGCFERQAEILGATRPTAVNLRWALRQGRELFERHRAAGPSALRAELLAWAERLHREDVAANRRIGSHGAALFAAEDRVLTHCNTGALATAGYGTALGVIRSAWSDGKVSLVWVDETRPLLQGARLTAWELAGLGIPHRLVTDSSAGTLLARGMVDRVVVGADRIAANGDAANKIGTYPLAVLAARHGVPFYVAAPLSTIDRETPSGDAIPIEERAGGEVTEILGQAAAPQATEGMNFAFDVTPAELIAAIITDVGVLEAPYEESIRRAFESAG